jgi:hypothetical protein
MSIRRYARAAVALIAAYAVALQAILLVSRRLSDRLLLRYDRAADPGAGGRVRAGAGAAGCRRDRAGFDVVA